MCSLFRLENTKCQEFDINKRNVQVTDWDDNLIQRHALDFKSDAESKKEAWFKDIDGLKRHLSQYNVQKKSKNKNIDEDDDDDDEEEEIIDENEAKEENKT